MDSAARSDRRRTYAEWFVWSGRNLTSNVEIRHACAEAATEAASSGGDAPAAARTAAQNRNGPGWTTRADPGVRSYAEWYDWARINLNLGGDALHSAAAAAIDALESGGSAAAGEAAARATLPGAAGTAPPAAPASQVWSPPPEPPPPPVGFAPAAPPPPAAPLPPAYAPPAPPAPPASYSYGGQPIAPAAASGGPVRMPVWVAVVLAVGCILSLLIGLVYTYALATPSLTDTSNKVLGSWIFLVVGYLMFAGSLAALVAIIVGAGWARVATIIAGALFCLSCVGIVLGVPVIIGAATARRAPSA